MAALGTNSNMNHPNSTGNKIFNYYFDVDEHFPTIAYK